jgi:hypothetical protein
VRRAAPGAHRRAGAIGRQLQHRGETVELLAPIGELVVEDVTGEQLALPPRKVRILDWQRL